MEHATSTTSTLMQGPVFMEASKVKANAIVHNVTLNENSNGAPTTPLMASQQNPFLQIHHHTADVQLCISRFSLFKFQSGFSVWNTLLFLMQHKTVQQP